MASRPSSVALSPGAAHALEALAAAHGREVARVCAALLRDRHLAADAAQEAFLRLAHRLAAQGPPDAPLAWLRRAAASAAVDLIRRRAAGPQVALASDLAEHGSAAGATGDPLEGARPRRDSRPDAAALRHELDERLAVVLAALPERQRDVFRLRHEAELPLAEVARCLGLSLSTAKTHLARACLALQGALAPFRPPADAAAEGDATPRPRARPGLPPLPRALRPDAEPLR